MTAELSDQKLYPDIYRHVNFSELTSELDIQKTCQTRQLLELTSLLSVYYFLKSHLSMNKWVRVFILLDRHVDKRKQPLSWTQQIKMFILRKILIFSWSDELWPHFLLFQITSAFKRLEERAECQNWPCWLEWKIVNKNQRTKSLAPGLLLKCRAASL